MRGGGPRLPAHGFRHSSAAREIHFGPTAPPRCVHFWSCSFTTDCHGPRGVRVSGPCVVRDRRATSNFKCHSPLPDGQSSLWSSCSQLTAKSRNCSRDSRDATANAVFELLSVYRLLSGIQAIRGSAHRPCGSDSRHLLAQLFAAIRPGRHRAAVALLYGSLFKYSFVCI